MSLRAWTDEELLSAPLRFVHARAARFQDVDAAGIVFYPRIVEYFHDAYVELLSAGGCALDQVLAEKAWIAPIRDVQARFLKPIRFGDRLEVAVVRAALEGSELRVGYRVQSAVEKAAMAIGQTSHVFVNPATGKRIDAPELIRAAFTAFPGA